MSRRQTSRRIEACAKEAVGIYQAFRQLEQDLRLLLRTWDSTQPGAMLSIIRDMADNLPQVRVDNSLSELAYLHASGAKIKAERERQRRRRGSQVQDSGPDLHYIPPPVPDTLIESINPGEDKAYQEFNQAQPPKKGEEIF